MTTTAAPRAPHTHWPRVIAIGIGLAAVVCAVVLAFLWPAATSSAHNLPIAIAGDAAQVSQLESALEEQAPDTFDFTEVDDRAAAVQAIEQREIYGAIVLGQEPEILNSSAANATVAKTLAGLQPVLQQQLNAALAAQGIQLPEPLVVGVTDVVPLSADDPTGAVLAASSFPLLIGGMIGGIAISTAIVGVWRRVSALLVYAIVGGLGIAGILQGWLGGLQGDYLVNAAAVSLAILSIGAVIVGFVSIVGRAGIAIGPVLFMLIANPISAATIPVEFIAAPWGAIGQLFPPGAAATLMRDLSYFPDAELTHLWLTLAVWAAAGLLLAVVGHFKDRGAATRAALREADAEPEPVAAG